MKKHIGTHGGDFHGDDVCAVAAAYLVGIVASVVRTRNPKKLAEADIRIDVGRKYNPATGDFDHHQEGGAGNRENGIPYASFGLVWKQYGPELCGSEACAKAVDQRLVQVIDANDVGVNLYSELNIPNAVPYTVSNLITTFNPPWYTNPKPQDYDRQFNLAVETAKAIILNEIAVANGVPIAREVIARGIAEAVDKRIVVLDRPLPRRELRFDDAPHVLFVILPSENGGNWAVRAVEKSYGMSYVRCSLPGEWAGKTGYVLAKLTGVPDAVFCHNSLFIATARTKEGAIAMANRALNQL